MVKELLSINSPDMKITVIIVVFMALVGTGWCQPTHGYTCNWHDDSDCMRAELEAVTKQLRSMVRENKEVKDKNHKLALKYNDAENEIQRLKTENKKLMEVNMNLNDSLQGCSPPTQSSCNQSTGTWISGGSKTSYTFSSVFNKVKVRNQTHVMYQFTEWADSMSVVGDKLWVPFINTIRVLDPYTPHNISMISHPQLTKLQEILQTNCTVIVSSDSGLHVLDIKGQYLYNITGGGFDGLCTGGDVVYVYKEYNNTAGYIVTLEYSSGRWGVKDTFPVRGGWSTITVVSDTLYVCPVNSHTISTYSLTGTYITQYGSWGSNSPGLLLYPLLCGQDNMGSLLVCNSNNDRLQVLSPNGTWQVVDLGLEGYPRDVVIDVSGTVWVLSGTVWGPPYKITRYLV